MKKNFLISYWIFNLGNSLSSPILSLYFYVTSSIYYSLLFVLLTSIFLLFGYIVSAFLSNFYKSSSLFYRIGIILYILFYLILLSLNVNAYHFIYLLSTFYGIAQGVYWFGWDVTFYNIPRKLSFFNKTTYLGAISSFTSPAIYGVILALFNKSGYLILFSITSLILLLATLLTENASINNYFNLIESITVFNKNKAYRFTMTSLAIVMGVNTVLSSLNPIFIYHIGKTYENFGILNYMLNAISLFSTYILRQRLISKIDKVKLVLTSSTAVTISGVSLLLVPLAYLVTYSLTSPLIYTIIDIYNWSNIDRNSLTRFLVNRQIFLNSGKIFFSLVETVFLANYLLSEEIMFILPALIISSIIFFKGKRRYTMPSWT